MCSVATNTTRPRRMTWLEERRRKKITSNTEWFAYFQSIRSQCPWSLAAFKRSKLQITRWKGTVLPLGDMDAIVYVSPNASAKQLKKIEKRLNAQFSQFEFLFSHPVYKHYSAPYPCLIQQDRHYLNLLRSKLDK